MGLTKEAREKRKKLHNKVTHFIELPCKNKSLYGLKLSDKLDEVNCETCLALIKFEKTGEYPDRLCRNKTVTM